MLSSGPFMGLWIQGMSRSLAPARFLSRPRGRRALLGVLLVVGVTGGAALYLHRPDAAADPPAQPSAAAATLTQRVAGRMLQLTVAPAAVGPNRLLLSIRDAQGRVVRGAGVSFTLTMRDMAMGQTVVAANPVRDGRYQAMATFTMPGHWAVTAQAGGHGLPAAGLRATFPVTAAFTPAAVVPTALPLAAGTTLRTTSHDPAPAAVPWAHLPYRAAVSFVDNGLVYIPGRPTLTRVGALNHSIKLAPDGTIWATNVQSDSVAIIDPRSGRVLTSVAVGLYPVHIAFTPDGRRAYVTNFYGSSVSVIDVRTRRVTATITVGLEPHGLTLTPDGRQVWVPCSLNGGMWVIDTGSNKVVGVALTGLTPHAAAVSPDERTVYMTDSSLGTLLAVDRATRMVRGRVAIKTGSAMVLVAPDGRRVYVTGQGGGVLTVVDARTLRIVARIPVGAAPHGIVQTPDGRYLYVAANNSRHVAVVDARTDRVVAKVAVPGAADELALLPR